MLSLIDQLFTDATALYFMEFSPSYDHCTSRGGHLHCNYFTCDSACAAIIFNGSTGTCAKSILAILNATALAQFEHD